MKQKQSIASKCSAFTAGLVILQSLLVLGMLIAGGILKLSLIHISEPTRH